MAECGLTKPEIRRLAEFWGLPTWDKPATPCLSSRIAYGEQVTPERLAMIDRAERFLRERGFQPLRVRYHKGDVARIEVAVEQLPKFAEPAIPPRSGRVLEVAGLQVRLARSGRFSQRQHERRAEGGRGARDWGEWD